MPPYAYAMSSVMLSCAALHATYCGLPRIGVQYSAHAHYLMLQIAAPAESVRACHDPDPGSFSNICPNIGAFEVST
jgi:hypothetical protein